MKRRFLQFSLRGFLIAVTVLTVGLGWKTERARRRGRAIDAIVDAGGRVEYASDDSRPRDFFLDMLLTPVEIELDYIGNHEAVVSQIIQAQPVQTLSFFGRIPDIGLLKRLNELNDGCEVVIDFVCTKEEGKAIERALPRAKVRWYVDLNCDTSEDSEP